MAGITLSELLKQMIEMGGSDLHLSTNSPPRVRVHGKLRPLDMPPLTAADTKALAYSVLTDVQKHRLEENLELDFSFGLKSLARFRGNIFHQRGAVLESALQVGYAAQELNLIGRHPRVPFGAPFRPVAAHVLDLAHIFLKGGKLRVCVFPKRCEVAAGIIADRCEVPAGVIASRRKNHVRLSGQFEQCPVEVVERLHRRFDRCHGFPVESDLIAHKPLQGARDRLFGFPGRSVSGSES